MATVLGFRGVRFPGPPDAYAEHSSAAPTLEDPALVTLPNAGTISPAGGFVVVPDYGFACAQIPWVGVFAPGEARGRVLLVTYDTGDITETIVTTKRAAGTSGLVRDRPSADGGIWVATSNATFPWNVTVDGTIHIISTGDVGDELTFDEACQLYERTNVDAILAAH